MFFREVRPLDSFSFAAAIVLSIAASLSDDDFFATSAISPTANLPPSITSLPSSTFRAGISAISGLLWSVFATGIFAVAAKPARTESFVIITIVLSADFAARDNNLMLTALCKIPVRLGGTSAIIRCFDALILPIMVVISSSISI